MKNIIANALISNTATIGVHWIYDYKFLEKLSNNQSLLFMDPKKSIYDQANSAYFVYPNYKVGIGHDHCNFTTLENSGNFKYRKGIFIPHIKVPII